MVSAGPLGPGLTAGKVGLVPDQGPSHGAKRGRRAATPGPLPVASSLGDAARLLGLDGAVELAAVNRSWAAAVGPQVAAHCWPVALAHGQLTVATDHPAWACELRILSLQLLSEISSMVPAVQSLVVQVSPRSARDW